jgi:hypothetical protein
MPVTASPRHQAPNPSPPAPTSICPACACNASTAPATATPQRHPQLPRLNDTRNCHVTAPRSFFGAGCLMPAMGIATAQLVDPQGSASAAAATGPSAGEAWWWAGTGMLSVRGLCEQGCAWEPGAGPGPGLWAAWACPGSLKSFFLSWACPGSLKSFFLSWACPGSLKSFFLSFFRHGRRKRQARGRLVRLSGVQLLPGRLGFGQSFL